MAEGDYRARVVNFTEEHTRKYATTVQEFRVGVREAREEREARRRVVRAMVERRRWERDRGYKMYKSSGLIL